MVIILFLFVYGITLAQYRQSLLYYVYITASTISTWNTYRLQVH